MVISISEYSKFLHSTNKLHYQLVGVDLSVQSVSRIDSKSDFLGSILVSKTLISEQYYTEVKSNKYDIFILEPGIYSFVFEQGIKLDSRHYAEIVPRSSLVRCGGVVGSGIYEPGFETKNIAAVVHLTNRIRIEKGARVVQVKIYKGEEFGIYNGQWNSENDIK